MPLSLWLMTEGDVHRSLAALIADLAARLGTPRFEPHVTLLGGLSGTKDEVVARSRDVAGATAPIVLRLHGVGWREEYFRCLFLEAEASEPLREAHRRAAEEFGRAGEARFEPHLSLVYGELPRSVKEAIRDEIGPGLPVEFRVRSLDVYRTDGDPAGWQRAARLPLKGATERG